MQVTEEIRRLISVYGGAGGDGQEAEEELSMSMTGHSLQPGCGLGSSVRLRRGVTRLQLVRAHLRHLVCGTPGGKRSLQAPAPR